MLVDLRSHLARFVSKMHYQVVTHSFIKRSHYKSHPDCFELQYCHRQLLLTCSMANLFSPRWF